MTDSAPIVPGKRVVVTGGSGFLGSFVVQELARRGYTDVMVPRSRDYDLVDRAAVQRLYRETRPELVIHLARFGRVASTRHFCTAFRNRMAVTKIRPIPTSQAKPTSELPTMG